MGAASSVASFAACRDSSSIPRASVCSAALLIAASADARDLVGLLDHASNRPHDHHGHEGQQAEDDHDPGGQRGLEPPAPRGFRPAA